MPGKKKDDEFAKRGQYEGKPGSPVSQDPKMAKDAAAKKADPKAAAGKKPVPPKGKADPKAAGKQPFPPKADAKKDPKKDDKKKK